MMYRYNRSRWLNSPPINPFAQDKRRIMRMQKALQQSMQQSITTLQKTLPAPPPFPFRNDQMPKF